ncbi:hypothetical protein [Hymenobacter glacialis]|uniref:Outer membrane protein beta-barrel domain-containing protein n=1 Tax=Hymenobacter glacialis TaxID=1908236 RepID=A0A1G1TAU1_9BACT|nr:hypothetical protein [Hymenobacter glacialis]OGX87990.1 hypothetical protein BEN48_10485 [Hymenobacter glacialis]
MKNILFASLTAALTFSFGAHAQDAPVKRLSYPPYRIALGILGNPKALGVQAEARFLKDFGARLAGVQQFDYQRANEYGGGGVALLTYYLPLKNKLIEAGIGLGAVYSLYHWDVGYDKGNLQDVNLGGGLGVNLRFSPNFRLGINTLVANGFEAGYVEDNMRAVRRKLLLVPALTFDVLL